MLIFDLIIEIGIMQMPCLVNAIAIELVVVISVVQDPAGHLTAYIAEEIVSRFFFAQVIKITACDQCRHAE
jgi:hypothetical protein